MRFDFLAYDSAGRRVLAVEVKRIRATSPDWARRFRRNLLAHGTLDVEWFTIVTPDRAYAWRGDRDAESQPDVTIDASSRLAPYLARIATTPERVSSAAFEDVVSWWLEDLATGRIADPELRSSGLAEKLEGATIVRQAA